MATFALFALLRIVLLGDSESPQSEILKQHGSISGSVSVVPPEALPREVKLRAEVVPRGGAPSARGRGVASRLDVLCPVEKGRFVCALPTGAWDLRLQVPSFVPSYRWGVRVDSGREVDLGRWALVAGASVVGRVVDDEGRPLASVNVRLSPQVASQIPDAATDQRLERLARQSTTNERGFFQFDGLLDGSYRVRAERRGAAPAQMEPVVVRDRLEAEIVEPLVLAPPAELAVILTPPLDPFGRPWQLQCVQVLGDGKRGAIVAQSAAAKDGRWRHTEIAAGEYRLLVADEVGSRWLDEPIEISRGGAPFEFEIPLIEVVGKVVRGREGVLGTLWLGGADGAERVRFELDEGEFAGFLPRTGTWRVSLAAQEPRVDLALKPVVVGEPRGGKPARLEIMIPDTEIRGRVVDESGRGVPQADLVVLGGHAAATQAQADAHGEFSLVGVDAGQLSIEAREGDRSSGPIAADVHEGVPTELALVVRREERLRGRVTTAGRGVPGATVWGWPSFGLAGTSGLVRAVSGPDGNFELRLPATEAPWTSLFVAAPGLAGKILGVQGRTERVEVSLDGAAGRLRIEVPLPRDRGARPTIPMLFHDGQWFPAVLLGQVGQMAQTATVMTFSAELEAGSYSACTGVGEYVRERRDPEGAATGRCQSGFLPRAGDLTLAAP